MKDSMKLTVAERNTLLELAHLLNEGLGDIAVNAGRTLVTGCAANDCFGPAQGRPVRRQRL
jgi:hypothetical protein